MTPHQIALYEQNKGLVHFTITKKLGIPYDVCKDDLYSDGKYYLLRACIKFDPNRGVKFSTFAVRVITNGLIDFLRAHAKARMIRLDHQWAQELPDPSPAPHAPSEHREVVLIMWGHLNSTQLTLVRERFAPTGKRRAFKQLGDRVGINHETARARMKRGLDYLQEKFHEFSEY